MYENGPQYEHDPQRPAVNPDTGGKAGIAVNPETGTDVGVEIDPNTGKPIPNDKKDKSPWPNK